MKVKTCQNCYHAAEASAVTRTILICKHKEGCEGRFFVVAPNKACTNFKAGRTDPLVDTNGAKLIPLTQGKFAIVDADDYEQLKKYKWYCHHPKRGLYATRSQGNKKITMHRHIMRASKGSIVDHVDRDGLNNRKSNLRLCSPAQNSFNKRPDKNAISPYKGVTWHKHHNKWHASISKSGKKYHLGSFDDEAEAARAYDRKAEELFGEFAYLNFP